MSSIITEFVCRYLIVTWDIYSNLIQTLSKNIITMVTYHKSERQSPSFIWYDTYFIIYYHQDIKIQTYACEEYMEWRKMRDYRYNGDSILLHTVLIMCFVVYLMMMLFGRRETVPWNRLFLFLTEINRIWCFMCLKPYFI